MKKSHRTWRGKDLYRRQRRWNREGYRSISLRGKLALLAFSLTKDPL